MLLYNFSARNTVFVFFFAFASTVAVAGNSPTKPLTRSKLKQQYENAERLTQLLFESFIPLAAIELSIKETPQLNSKFKRQSLLSLGFTSEDLKGNFRRLRRLPYGRNMIHYQIALPIEGYASRILDIVEESFHDPFGKLQSKKQLLATWASEMIEEIKPTEELILQLAEDKAAGEFVEDLMRSMIESGVFDDIEESYNDLIQKNDLEFFVKSNKFQFDKALLASISSYALNAEQLHSLASIDETRIRNNTLYTINYLYKIGDHGSASYRGLPLFVKSFLGMRDALPDFIEFLRINHPSLKKPSAYPELSWFQEKTQEP